jgi:hypothetical protein
MAGFSNNLAQATINHFFRNVSQSAPANHYLALFIADPTDVTATALTNEVSASWYARQSISFDAPSNATDVITANTAQILFSAVTGTAVTVTHWGIFDASTTGNLMCSGAFATSKTLNVDDVFVVNSGDLTLTFD